RATTRPIVPYPIIPTANICLYYSQYKTSRIGGETPPSITLEFLLNHIDSGVKALAIYFSKNE
ncbi:MAG: hypothetical protein EBR92_02785, partial [Alphaproteobacteria bacterium]|nr:hypothetical protein [Alphaproteobacteria bacterium]